MRNKRAFGIFFGFLLGSLAAAATPYATISYAEGTSFMLIRDGKTTTWTASDAKVFGMEIKPGDIIQTGTSTFLELAINPIAASVQIAENTSFRCDASDPEGTKSTGELYYGRVRAKVSKLSPTSSYRITSPSLVAGVRGTDFGCDVIAIRPVRDAAGVAAPATGGNPILNRVFCFEGSVLVAEAAGKTMNTVMIGKDEMIEKIVSADVSGVQEAAQSLQKKSLVDEVHQFWQLRPIHPVSFTPIAAAPAAAAAVVSHSEGNLTVTDRPWPSGREEPSVKKQHLPDKAVMLLIAFGTVSCLASSQISEQGNNDSRLVVPAYTAGWVMIGSGTVLTLISLFAR